MQALAPGHVVYAGTASKSLAPGLWLGWLVLPAGLVGEVVPALQASGPAGGVLDQLTLAEFITSGGYDRQVRHVRLSYRRRRDQLAAMLRQQVPRVAVTGISAGMHALVRLPDGCTEEEVVARGARHGLALEGLAGFRAAPHAAGTDPGHGQQALVVGFGRPPEHAYTAALARLCAVLAAA
jgi:GntR family transcriptional regulator/MocR family aminotransferase